MSRSPSLSPQVQDRLLLRTEPWLSCEDCFELMDGFAEVLARDGQAGRAGVDLAMELHLRGCPGCFEEVESLVALLREDAAASRAAH
ncbi:hypothetical protein [Arsenicicoccus piscis]|uniref:Zinc-finger domain-containing protein n=1 Tax=Arsenicicoccus piscis TaxID=673954 RepID=A0ABQ6HJL6_9MICO|nr:hypothetical protein [Arsenicicoccus piscis]GMA18643.1 hypothetical protein GCM10025862_06640 [Arsenicicoccus piscis]